MTLRFALLLARYTACGGDSGNGGANLQFPGAGTQCAPGITIADPQLGPLADNGGPTKIMLPAASSPARLTGCPAIDQRGSARASSCTLGAVEAN